MTLAKKNGKKIPEGWAIDKDGHSTTDPNKVSCMLPFGGAKGYGIGLLIELMCCGLAGAKSGLTMDHFMILVEKSRMLVILLVQLMLVQLLKNKNLRNSQM